MHGIFPISCCMKQFIIVILQYLFKTDNRFDITVLACALIKTYLETITCRNCIHDFINNIA